MDSNPTQYLDSSEVINFRSEAIAQLAQTLKSDDALTTAKRCFEFVRDEIKHSSDYQLNPVTCSASDVLTHGTGYCYAKSHLLCALLRANEIPAGLCYQRLSIDGHGAPFCLHGLVAVCLPKIGWYRIDPRGNRDDGKRDTINAQFTPPVERLAFRTDLAGEYDLPGIFVSPLPEVTSALAKFETWDALYKNLPDAAESLPG